MDLAMVVLAVLVGLFAFAGIMGLSYAMTGRLSVLEDRVRSIRNEYQGSGQEWRDRFDRSLRVVRRLGELVPRSPAEMSRQQRRLVQAGFRSKDAPCSSSERRRARSCSSWSPRP
jgi:hypothetical protein